MVEMKHATLIRGRPRFETVSARGMSESMLRLTRSTSGQTATATSPRRFAGRTIKRSASEMLEKTSRHKATSMMKLREDEHARLNPPLLRSNRAHPRDRDYPPMWDRATLSSDVQPTAYPSDPRDEKTWWGNTGYPLVYPGDHRHEWTRVEFQDRDYPRRPWKLTHTRGIAAEEAQARAPRFRTIPIGEKLTVQGCTDVKKAADSS